LSRQRLGDLLALTSIEHGFASFVRGRGDAHHTISAICFNSTCIARSYRSGALAELLFAALRDFVQKGLPELAKKKEDELNDQLAQITPSEGDTSTRHLPDQGWV
jgi:hypothetical protein